MALTPPAQLRISLTAPESARLGSTVPVIIQVQNTGDAAIELYLRGREIAYDVLFKDATGETVWRRLEGEVIPGVIQLRVLVPGEVLELSHKWNQRTNRGELVRPGVYTVEGTVLTDGPNPLAPTSQQIVIGPG